MAVTPCDNASQFQIPALQLFDDHIYWIYRPLRSLLLVAFVISFEFFRMLGEIFFRFAATGNVKLFIEISGKKQYRCVNLHSQVIKLVE